MRYKIYFSLSALNFVPKTSNLVHGTFKVHIIIFVIIISELADMIV